MTVAQLIAELQRYPGYVPVAGYTPRVIVPDCEQPNRMHQELTIAADEAQEVTQVVYEGRFVTLECDGACPAYPG